MILLKDSEGPDCTDMQADLGFCCLHVSDDMFSYGAAHLWFILVKITNSRIEKKKRNEEVQEVL